MNLLDRLQLKFRCPADWEAMEGDERKRFCSHCQKHVHNLSAMTRDEAVALVGSGQNLCVRMERRGDGSTVVKDCPQTRVARDTAARLAGAGLAAGSALALAACGDAGRPPEQRATMGEMICPVESSTGGELQPLLGSPAVPEKETDPADDAAVVPEAPVDPGEEPRMLLGEICPVDPEPAEDDRSPSINDV